MKTVYIVAALVLGWALYRSYKRRSATVAVKSAAQQTLDTVRNLRDSDPTAFLGGYSIDKLVKADQDKYPGYYLTPDGGYINPTTGATYSQGSSPPVVHSESLDLTNLDWTKPPEGVTVSQPGTFDVIH